MGVHAVYAFIGSRVGESVRFMGRVQGWVLRLWVYRAQMWFYRAQMCFLDGLDVLL